MDVFKVEKDSFGNDEKSTQIHAPKFSGTFQLSYTLRKANITIDYTGQDIAPCVYQFYLMILGPVFAMVCTTKHTVYQKN